MAETRIEEARVMHAELAHQGIERHHLGGIVAWDIDHLLGGQDLELPGIEDQGALASACSGSQNRRSSTAQRVDIHHPVGAWPDSLRAGRPKPHQRDRHPVLDRARREVTRRSRGCRAELGVAQACLALAQPQLRQRVPVRTSTGNVRGRFPRRAVPVARRDACRTPGTVDDQR